MPPEAGSTAAATFRSPIDVLQCSVQCECAFAVQTDVHGLAVKGGHGSYPRTEKNTCRYVLRASNRRRSTLLDIKTRFEVDPAWRVLWAVRDQPQTLFIWPA